MKKANRLVMKMSDEKKGESCRNCCCDFSAPQSFGDLIGKLKDLDLSSGSRDTQVETVKKLMDSYVSKEEDFDRFVYWSKHK